MRIILRQKLNDANRHQDVKKYVESFFKSINSGFQIESIELLDDRNVQTSEQSRLLIVRLSDKGTHVVPGHDGMFREAASKTPDLEFIEIGNGHRLAPLMNALEEPKEKGAPLYYCPSLLGGVRTGQYSYITTVNFAIQFNLLTTIDGIRIARKYLFDEIFGFLKSPCIMTHESYANDHMGGYFGLKGYVSFFTNTIDKNALHQRLVSLVARMSNTGFEEGYPRISHGPIDLEKTVYSCRKPVNASIFWDSRRNQQGCRAIFETKSDVLSADYGDEIGYDYDDACGVLQISAMGFRYKDVDVDVCMLRKPSKESTLENAAMSFVESHPECSPKTLRVHPKSASTRFVLFKPEKKTLAEEFKQKLCEQGFHAYIRETPESKQVSVLVDLKK